MYIEELNEGEQRDNDRIQSCGESLVVWDAKRVLVGAGACALVYPTLFYNVVRNKIQSEFRWWDRVDEDASLGKTTYVDCKAGRGHSTTIFLCYLVEHRHMTPDAAYEYARSIRRRVLLVPTQQQAVQDYYLHKVKNNGIPGNSCCMIVKKTIALPTELDTAAFDDVSVVFITESDLDGYDSSFDAGLSAKEMLGEGSLADRFQFASQAAIARLSCLRFRCHADQKTSRKPGLLSSLRIDIWVY